ncbi:MAG TPA: transglycosylase SLT domain-containing protein [Bryobacteraceae bacterium]|jgi:membrane-bound lytic murein transglycosylase D
MMLRLRPIVAEIILLSATTIGVSHAAQEQALPHPTATVSDNAADSSAVTSSGPSDASLFDSADTAESSLSNGGAQSSEASDCLKKAESHFNSGRQLYFQGNVAGARKEFDQAVDVLLAAPESLPDRGRIERRLDEMCDLIYRFDVEKLGAGKHGEDEAAAFDQAPIDEISHMTFPVDPSLAPKLQTELNQTSSGIPLELSDPVLGFVHYFSTEKGRHTLISGLKRSGRYRPLIERIFNEEGLPLDLVYLAQAESGFLPRAVSYKSAVGMWQFTAPAGFDYDLAHTKAYDERLDPEKATRAAAHYLKALYARYGDWYLAMAAYNCGPGVIDRAVERTGYADYWELAKRNVLPRETAAYVPIIVAITIMAKNPKDYGIEDVVMDSPVEYDSISLSAPTNLNLIADATLQPISVIRDLNPSLLTMVAPSGFQVHLPKDTSESAQAALESVPAANRQAWRLHHVTTGDTLATIARSYHVTPERIVQVNNQSDTLEAGDTLMIPAVYVAPPKPSRRSAVHGHETAKTQAHHGAAIQSRTRVTAARHVSPRILHRKAAVHTAGLQR